MSYVGEGCHSVSILNDFGLLDLKNGLCYNRNISLL